MLESQAPEIDEVIHITSSLNVTSYVKFNLNFAQANLKSSREFRAELTHNSASEFGVSPKSGTVDSSNR